MSVQAEAVAAHESPVAAVRPRRLDSMRDVDAVVPTASERPAAIIGPLASFGGDAARTPVSPTSFSRAPRTIQRKCACCETGEERPLLPKLEVGARDDRFEREADRVAATVVAAGGAAVTQRRAAPRPRSWPAPTPGGRWASAIAGAAAAVAGSGRPLTRRERSFFEPRLGRNLSAVRLHEGPLANAAAEAIGARAYALGSDIALGAGEYRFEAAAGRRLLAHELAHVVQQSPARAGVIARQDRGQDQPSGVVVELPVEFVAAPDPEAGVPAGVGTGLSASGLSAHVLASGELGWLPPSAGAQRVLTPEYWSPFVPGRGYTSLDRLTNTLPRNLAPRIAEELASGQPLTWVVQRGFTEAELRSIPELIRRLNTAGIDSLAPDELTMLRRAARIHIGGASPGAPFASFTAANYTPPFLQGTPPRYRVRIEVPSANVLDVSVPNAFNLGEEALTNIEEAEFLLAADHEGRIVAVERAAPGGRPGFAMRHAGAIRWGGRVLFVAGVGVSAYRISQANAEERPIVAAEEVGGQLGGAAGTALAVAGCVAFGVLTSGVGLFVCGLVGGIGGGLIGSELGGGAARSLRETGGGAQGQLGTGGGARILGVGGEVCPSCHELQRAWEAQRSSFAFEGLTFDPSLLPPDALPLSPRPDVPGAATLTPEDIDAIWRWVESAQPELGPTPQIR